MTGRFTAYTTVLAVLVSLVPFLASAEPLPGDACSTLDQMVSSGGPETGGARYFLRCNGSAWQQELMFSSADRTGIRTDLPAAPLHVNGEAIIGPSTGIACVAAVTGGLRWSSVNSTFELCDGTAWRRIAATASSSDCTPDAFSFTDVTDQSLSSLILSNSLNITGIDVDCVVSISGSGSPQISVNGGTWAAVSTINPGDSLRVRQLSSSATSTARIAAVAIGSATDNWSVTTRAGQLRVFATSGTYNGNLGGLSGADSVCQTEAGSAGYAGTFKAVLSDATTNAKDRLTLIYPIVRASSTSTVVESTNLWASSLEASVFASALSANVKSGTDSAGVKAANTCNSWTTNSSGVAGWDGSYLPLTGAAWISSLSEGCHTPSHIICIEQ